VEQPNGTAKNKFHTKCAEHGLPLNAAPCFETEVMAEMNSAKPDSLGGGIQPFEYVFGVENRDVTMLGNHMPTVMLVDEEELLTDTTGTPATAESSRVLAAAPSHTVASDPR